MVSVKNEINEILLNTINDLENKLNESRNVLENIQLKMDDKVSEAKEYKVSVDDAKEQIKRLEEEIKSLESDLDELKEKYGKKNLVAVIEAGTKEINHEIKKKQDEIQIHKNKIAELTNRARSIKDLLINLKKDKKIKSEKLTELENCTNYYKVRLESIVKFAEEHEDLNDFFEKEIKESSSDEGNVFEDIVNIEENETENTDSNINFEDINLTETDEVFNDVINVDDEEIEIEEENIVSIEPEVEDEKEDVEESKEEIVDEDEQTSDESDEPILSLNDNIFTNIEEEKNEEEQENFHSLEINNLLSSGKVEPSVNDKIDNINKAIDEEFANIFGNNINEPIKTIDIFGNEYDDTNNETDIVNTLTNLGLDYYSFSENDRNIIKNDFNEKIIAQIVETLNNKNISLDNIYFDASILTNIAPRELESIIEKLINAGQSAETIGYVLDKLPLVDAKKLEETINNYGDYIKNVDIADILVKSLKGDN